MKRKLLEVFTSLFLITCLSGTANAALTTIGTASYNGSEYNLIYDDDNNGQSLLWLDYSFSQEDAAWQDHLDWASSLNSLGTLTYNLNPGVTINLAGGWRLPSAGGSPSIAYNVTTSEMGHLYYGELGNAASSGLNSTGDFNNLLAEFYWCKEAYNAPLAWVFYMNNGALGVSDKNNILGKSLAVNSVDVSLVPLPGAIWFFGSGLICLLGLGRKKRSS